MKKIFFGIVLSLFFISNSFAAIMNTYSNITESSLADGDEFVVWHANAVKNITVADLWDYYVAQSEYINPAFASINCYGETGIALGTSGTYAGKTVYKSGTDGNNYYFTIQGSNFGANLTWTLPTAAPGGANYLLNVDADGTMGYTDPSTISGVISDLDDLPNDTVDNDLIDGSIVQTNTATSAGVVASGAAQVSKVWKTDADGVPDWRDDSTGAGYTNLTSFVDQTAWRVFYSDGSGDVKELALGNDGEYLKSNGAALAPSWATPSGAAHDAVTLSTDLGTNLLGLSTQQLTLDNQNANVIFAGPSTGEAAAPTFRSMVAADVPTLNQNTTGTAANLSGTPALPNGTTATTQTQADNTTKLATTAYVDTGLGGKQASVTWGTGLAESGGTASLAATELDDVTWGAAAGGSQTWTFDTGAATDPTMTISDNYFTFNKVLQCAGIETTRSATVGGSVIIGYEGSNNGDSYISHKSPDARDTTLILLYPTADPATGQSIKWSAPSDTVTTGSFYDPVEEGVDTGGIILGDSTPDAEKELGYASNQLSIHDGTASRSILQVASTVITKTAFLPIRYAEDGTTAPAAAAEIGTTAVVARSFVEDADNDVWFNWLVPIDYSAGLKYRVIYAIQTDADADETVAFSLAGCSTADTEAMACSEGTAVVVTDELTTDFDAAETTITGWSSAVTVTGIAAGEFARLHFLRDVSEDDYAGASDNTLIVGIEIKYQAKLNSSGDY